MCMYVCCFFCGCETCETRVPSRSLALEKPSFFSAFFSLVFVHIKWAYMIYMMGERSACVQIDTKVSLARFLSLSFFLCSARCCKLPNASSRGGGRGGKNTTKNNGCSSSRAQIERDLSDPRVHKRIVENLYGAYKTRVRSSFDLSFRSRVVLNRVFLSAFYRKKRDGKRRRTRSQTLRLLRDTTTTTKCRPREGEKDRSKEDEETPRWSG